jgi:hypothetical protein
MNVSSFIFTRNSRFTLLLTCWVLQMVFQAVFYRHYQEDTWEAMFLFALIAAVLSKPFQLFYGNFLYNDYELQKVRWETFDKKVELKCYLAIQNQDYYFYFLCFITVVAGWWANCYCMYG